MNKRLLIAVGVLTAAVCAIGVIGSGAWFTDSEKVEVDASSARLDVQLDVCGPGGGTADGGVAVAWPISGLAPGQMQSKCIHIQNKAAPGSTLPVKYRYRVANIDGDPADVASLNIHAYRADCSLTGPATFVYDGPLTGMDGSNFDGPRRLRGRRRSLGRTPARRRHALLLVRGVRARLGRQRVPGIHGLVRHRRRRHPGGQPRLGPDHPDHPGAVSAPKGRNDMNKKLIILTAAAVAAVAAFGVIGSGGMVHRQRTGGGRRLIGVARHPARGEGARPRRRVCHVRGTADNGTPVSWDLTNLAPGDVRIRCINVQNKPSPASTLPVKYRYRTENAVGDPTLLAANLTVSRGLR